MASVPSQETVNETDERTKPPFLRRVRIRGYKSIAFCDVPLRPLTILVGRNAAGKSNFLDALAFFRDVMAIGVPESVTRRGGWSAIACRTTAVDKIELEIEAGFTCGNLAPQTAHNRASDEAERDLLGQTITARYHLILSRNEFSVPQIANEILEIKNDSDQRIAQFEMKDGMIQWEKEMPTPDWIPMIPESKQLFRSDNPLLGIIGFQPIMDLRAGLRHITTYNFIPKSMRRPQPPAPGQLLDQIGWNLASVIEGLKKIEPESLRRIQDYLRVITPEIEDFGVIPLGGYETVRFRLRGEAGQNPLEFDAASMSDGTLRALAALMAAFQVVLPLGYPSVVGIEEPEAALHPAAMQALVHALDDATQRTQVLLTTHSGELLSGRDVSPGQVLVVRNRGGKTYITPVDKASREIIQKELYTLAELQRMDKLDVDEADLKRQAQLNRQGGV